MEWNKAVFLVKEIMLSDLPLVYHFVHPLAQTCSLSPDSLPIKNVLLLKKKKKPHKKKYIAEKKPYHIQTNYAIYKLTMPSHRERKANYHKIKC